MGKTYRGLHRIGNTSQHGEAPEVIIETENITVIPSKNEQIIKRSEGKYIDTATIKPIPDEYIVPEGVLEVKENGTYDVTNKETVDVDVPSEDVILQDKTVIPTKERQVVTADEDYTGIGNLTVEPIPDEYIVPEGALNIDKNGSYNVKDKESVNVEVPGEVVNLQNKSVTPTKELQNVSADEGYTGLGTVEVEAIPDEYIIPSGNIDISSNQVVDVTQYSQATISVPTGGGSGEDSLGKMLLGEEVNFIDTQGSITAVPSSAMTGDFTKVKKLELPECSYVNSGAFLAYSYSGQNQANIGITEVSLPKCTTIGSSAFYFRKNLSQVYAPNLTTIGESAFAQCGIKNIDNFVKLSQTGNNTFYGCIWLSSVSLSGLVQVGMGAFSGCTNLASVNFPNVSSVAQDGFANCTSLRDLILDFDKITGLYSTVFSGCTSLKEAVYPNCRKVGYYTFYRCANLSNVSFPVCSEIGSSAFTYCSNLQSAYFPECTKIGANALSTCPSLTTINFPKLSIVNSGAFYNCPNLAEVSLPICNTLRSSAFSNCTGLEKISLPNLSLINNGAFNNCQKLSMLILASTSIVKLSHIGALTNTPLSKSTYLGYFGSIYVPRDLVDSYKTSTNWTNFAERITSIDNLPTV